MDKNEEQSNLELPLVCNLSEAEIVQRRTQLADEIFAAVTEVNELADGYELAFPGEGMWLTKLADFVTFERECCPFLTFDLVCLPNQGPIWLRLRGGAEVKTFLRHELQLL